MEPTRRFSRHTFLAGAAAMGGALAAGSLLPAESFAAPSRAAVNVTEWSNYSGDSETYEKNRVKQFNRSHSNEQVSVQFVPDPTTKLLASIAAGNPPDLVTAQPNVLGFQAGLTDLTPYLKTLGWSPSQMVSSALPTMEYGGKVWAVCELGSLTFLYINKTLFRQAGLDPNKPPTTIAELDAYADKLTTYDSKRNIKTLGFAPWAEDGSGAYWAAWLWQWVFGANFTKRVNGKLMLTLTDPAAIRALNWEASYGKKYGVDQLSTTITNAGNPFSINDLFISGKMGMMIGGQWHTEALRTYSPKLDYAVYPIPAPPGGRKNASIVKFNTWVVPQGAKHPLEALRYALWAGTGAPAIGNENIWRTFSAYRQGPNSPKNVWQKQHDPTYSLIEKLIVSPNATPGPVLPISAELDNEITVAEQSVYYGKATAESALSQLQNRMQPLLDKALHQ